MMVCRAISVKSASRYLVKHFVCCQDLAEWKVHGMDCDVLYSDYEYIHVSERSAVCTAVVRIIQPMNGSTRYSSTTVPLSRSDDDDVGPVLRGLASPCPYCGIDFGPRT